MSTYTVTAATPEGERVWLDVAPNGWLVILREPTVLTHGPRIKDVVWAAVTDPHLHDIRVNEQEQKE
jgi:hypothetical protein